MHNPILMLNVLRRDFPEIAVRISENIDSEMPSAILTDSDQIPWIIEDFSELRGIAYDTWNNQPGQSRITNERELLLAIVIMFYQPEKITGLHDSRIKQGIVKMLSNTMGCSKAVISQSISCAIDNYRIYADFRLEVDQLYDTLKSNYHG